MKHLLLTIAIVEVALLMLFAGSVMAQTDSIIVTDADGELTVGVTVPESVPVVAPHIIVTDYTNGNTLNMVDSAELRAGLNAIPDRITIDLGDGNLGTQLTRPPSSLYDPLVAIGIVQPACDVPCPLFILVNITDVDATQAIISWDSQSTIIGGIEYGIESGVYPDLVQDSDATNSHTNTLTDLVDGIVYYRLVTIEADGTTSGLSPEYSFIWDSSIPAPLAIGTNQVVTNSVWMWGVVGVAVCILTIASYSAWRRRGLR